MDGNRADICIYSKAGVARLNAGQFYEHYINAASRDMSKWIRNNYSINTHEDVWNRLLAYYEAAAPEQYKMTIQLYKTQQEQIRHIQDIIDKGIYLVISPVSEHLNPDIVSNIEKIIKPTYGPVSYIDMAGNLVTTKDNVFIGINQIIVLEKTELRPMAISSACLQHHGLISGNNKEIRYSHPSKQQATRVLGETEVRLFAAAMGPDAVANMLDMANNPESHREVVNSILSHDRPINIPEAVNRNKIPLGNSRALAFFNHVLFCAGVKIVDGQR